MLVYHGTNANIAEIDLTKGTRFKDFGQGFYVTPDLETAQRMARKIVPCSRVSQRSSAMSWTNPL